MPHSRGLSNNSFPEPHQNQLLVFIPISVKSIHILSSHLRLAFSKGLFLLGVHVKMLKALLPPVSGFFVQAFLWKLNIVWLTSTADLVHLLGDKEACIPFLRRTIKYHKNVHWIPCHHHINLKVNHFCHFVHPVTGIHTNTILPLWQLLLRRLSRIEFSKGHECTHGQIFVEKWLRQLKCRPFPRNPWIYAEILTRVLKQGKKRNLFCKYAHF